MPAHAPSASTEPERRVWDWLAAHGVPFAEPAPDLVARFGTDTDQPSGEPLCRLVSARPLVPGQLAPLAFDPLREPGPPAPPHQLQTAVYDGRDARASFDVAEALAAWAEAPLDIERGLAC